MTKSPPPNDTTVPVTKHVFCAANWRSVTNKSADRTQEPEVCGWNSVIGDSEEKGNSVVGCNVEESWIFRPCVTRRFLRDLKEGNAAVNYFIFRLDGAEIYIAKKYLKDGISDYFRFLVQDPALAKTLNGTIDLSSHIHLDLTTLKQALEFVCTNKYNNDREEMHMLITLQHHCRVYSFAKRIQFQELLDASYSAASLILEALKGMETMSDSGPVSMPECTDWAFWPRFNRSVNLVYQGIKDSDQPEREIRFGNLIYVQPKRDKLKEALVSVLLKIMEKRKHKSNEFSRFSYKRLIHDFPELARDILIVMEGLRDEDQEH